MIIVEKLKIPIADILEGKSYKLNHYHKYALYKSSQFTNSVNALILDGILLKYNNTIERNIYQEHMFFIPHVKDSNIFSVSFDLKTYSECVKKKIKDVYVSEFFNIKSALKDVSYLLDNSRELLNKIYLLKENDYDYDYDNSRKKIIISKFFLTHSEVESIRKNRSKQSPLYKFLLLHYPVFLNRKVDEYITFL